MKKFFLLLILLISTTSFAQFGPISDEQEDDSGGDLKLGSSDIFNDFNEDLESSQVLEDERFYRYGRFFSANIGFGFTRFTGNRGAAYVINPDPSIHFSLSYFLNFRSAFVLGIEYSRHTMLIDTFTNGHKTYNLGAVNVNMIRPFLAYKYYFDTADFGNAITYSNPHLIFRMQYWYQNNEFSERPQLDDLSGGGIGTGVGFGLEFPVKLKEYYIGVEGIFHQANFLDKFTSDYQQIDDPNSTYGFQDLTGNAFTLFITFNNTW